jgi:hypothetical protein
MSTFLGLRITQSDGKKGRNYFEPGPWKQPKFGQTLILPWTAAAAKVKIYLWSDLISFIDAEMPA